MATRSTEMTSSIAGHSSAIGAHRWPVKSVNCEVGKALFQRRQRRKQQDHITESCKAYCQDFHSSRTCWFVSRRPLTSLSKE